MFCHKSSSVYFGTWRQPQLHWPCTIKSPVPPPRTIIADHMEVVTNQLQWNLDLSFFKGVEKTLDEYGETINPENHFF
jgi:hypothetical protein